MENQHRYGRTSFGLCRSCGNHSEFLVESPYASGFFDEDDIFSDFRGSGLFYEDDFFPYRRGASPVADTNRRNFRNSRQLLSGLFGSPLEAQTYRGRPSSQQRLDRGSVEELDEIFDFPADRGRRVQEQSESVQERRAQEQGESEQGRRAKEQGEREELKSLIEKADAACQRILRIRIAGTVDPKVELWAAEKEGNLRAILSSLQDVLWPDSGWEPVSLTDLITSGSVKKVYRKATLCVHPDKVQQKGASLQQKYTAEKVKYNAEKVFDILKEAWTKFNKEELS